MVNSLIKSIVHMASAERTAWMAHLNKPEEMATHGIIVAALYCDYLEKPLWHNSHHLLHMDYFVKYTIGLTL